MLENMIGNVFLNPIREFNLLINFVLNIKLFNLFQDYENIVWNHEQNVKYSDRRLYQYNEDGFRF